MMVSNGILRTSCSIESVNSERHVNRDRVVNEDRSVSDWSVNGGIHEADIVVCFKNAWKSHDKENYALRNLTLSVPRGTIYSILGSSGSGKTSILNCIVGNISLDSGHVQVKVPAKLNIGYMPQELALYEDLTVIEILKFFSILYGMRDTEVEKRSRQLIELLEIPTRSNLIKDLSGGQRRRVSLAVSMLNDPELLVLDEPTVGLDSVLRDKIWQHLLEIIKNKTKTVVITTHYIEEAKNSSMVCFLKEGKSLLEGSPCKLVSNYKTNSLEEIYFLIHWEDHQQRASRRASIPNPSHLAVKSFKDEKDLSLTRILAFTSKTLMQIRRNPLMFYICLLLPGLLFILLREASRPPHLINIGYLNLENNCDQNITKCSIPLSCIYLNRLRVNQFITVELDSIKKGINAVKKNQVWAFLYFTTNFTQTAVERLEYFTADEQNKYAVVDTAAAWVDMSSYVISEMLLKLLHDSYNEALSDLYRNCQWNTHYVKPILKLESYINGIENKSESTNSAAIPGAVILIVYTISMSVGLISILTEKESGTYLRCKALGLSSTEMLLSELLSSECVLIPPAVLLVALMYFYWGQSQGNPIYVFLLLFVQLNTGIINGLLISLVTKNLTLALLISTGVATVSSYITGVMWPIEGMHWTSQWINKLLPVSMAVTSMQAITSRGATILDPQVAQGFINSAIWIAVFLLLIKLVLWRQQK